MKSDYSNLQIIIDENKLLLNQLEELTRKNLIKVEELLSKNLRLSEAEVMIHNLDEIKGGYKVVTILYKKQQDEK